MTDVEINQVLSNIEISLVNMESIVAAMKQTNTSMVPLRQQILSMWRDNLSIGIENISECIKILKELERSNLEKFGIEKVETKKAALEFSVKKKIKK